MRERGAEAAGHRRGRLRGGVGEVEHAEHDRLGRQRGQRGEVEPRLRRLDRDLARGAPVQLGQERVAARLVLHGERVAEAQVHAGELRDAGEGAVDGGHGVGAGAVRPRLHVRLVELQRVHERLQLPQLLVHGRRVRHRQPLLVPVVLVLGELREREGARQRHLDRAVGDAAQEGHLTREHGPRAPDRADHPRDRRRLAGAGDGHPRALEVEAVEGVGELVEVALPPLLAVGDEVDPRPLHVAHRQAHRVVLRLVEQRLGQPPDLAPPHAGDGVGRELRLVHQPVGLRVAAHHRRRDPCHGCFLLAKRKGLISSGLPGARCPARS